MKNKNKIGKTSIEVKEARFEPCTLNNLILTFKVKLSLELRKTVF